MSPPCAKCGEPAIGLQGRNKVGPGMFLEKEWLCLRHIQLPCPDCKVAVPLIEFGGLLRYVAHGPVADGNDCPKSGAPVESHRKDVRVRP